MRHFSSTLDPETRDPGPERSVAAPKAARFVEHFPTPAFLHDGSNQHSRHSSKNTTTQRYAYAGGRDHKASLTSTRSSGSRRMTTEEKMSEVDEFFGLDDDHDTGSPIDVTRSVGRGGLDITACPTTSTWGSTC
jgi:hypothetical protein